MLCRGCFFMHKARHPLLSILSRICCAYCLFARYALPFGSKESASQIAIASFTLLGLCVAVPKAIRAMARSSFNCGVPFSLLPQNSQRHQRDSLPPARLRSFFDAVYRLIFFNILHLLFVHAMLHSHKLLIYHSTPLRKLKHFDKLLLKIATNL